MLLMGMSAYADQEFTWSLKHSKSQLYMNEAVELEYTCRITKDAILYVIEFDPPKETEQYRFFPLGVIKKSEGNIHSYTYRFVMFLKASGEQKIRFKALMRKTTQASIENSVIGRDNVEDYAFDDTEVILPEVTLDVMAHQETMTGDFRLKVDVDRQELQAYEPLHLNIEVEGAGDFDQLQEFQIDIEGVTAFSEGARKSYTLSADGFKGSWKQQFSLVSEDSFVIESLHLRYFDVAKKEVVTLNSERFEIKVNPAFTQEELLDHIQEDTPSVLWQLTTLFYLLTLIIGIIIGRFSIQLLSRPQERSKHDGDLDHYKSVNGLLARLAVSSDRRFDGLIQKYERQSGTAALKALKKELKTLLKNANITKKDITDAQ